MNQIETAKVVDLARQLTTLISQTIYGHHPPLVYQLLMGISALEDALPLIQGKDESFTISKELLQDMRNQIDKLKKRNP